jgi:hypothetical protein
MCNLGDKRVVRVGVGQHGADGEEHYHHICQPYAQLASLKLYTGLLPTFANGQSRAPLVSEDVQADASVRVDVGVVDPRGEVDLGGLEGVVGREVDGEEKDTARVR